ncbi:MAG: ABC transporter ATP-binding protein, partial [Mycoplasmataceae bacterium]|nr:ABC transporter ATP-binding protein [Mycoplasmataceae bacterium]
KSDMVKEYKKVIKDFNELKLPTDEVDLIKTTKKIELTSKQIKRFDVSLDSFIKKNNIEKKKIIKKHIKSSHDFLGEYIDDQKRTIAFRKQLASISKTNAENKYHMDKAKIAKKEYKRLKNISKNKLILSREEAENLNDVHKKNVIFNGTNLKEVEAAEKESDFFEEDRIIELLKVTQSRIEDISKKYSKNKLKEEEFFANFDVKKHNNKLEKLQSQLEKDVVVFNSEKEKYLKNWSKEYEEAEAEANILGEKLKSPERNNEYKTLEISFKKNFEILLSGFTKIEQQKYKKQISERQMKRKNFALSEKLLIKSLGKLQYIMGIKQTIPPIKKYLLGKMILQDKVFDALSQVGLKAEHAYRYPHEFSGGQKQRIVIARALIMDPKIIVADEPIASLDVSIQAQILNILMKLAKDKNIGMLFIAHDLSVVQYVSDRTLVMHLGKIVESGDTKKIFKKPVHPYTNTLFEAIPRITAVDNPFIDVATDNSYLREYAQNNPKQVEFEKGHFVLMNEEQQTKWLKEKSNGSKS